MNDIELDNTLLSNLQYFCIFIGYPYSGHSLIGSIIDAHPNAAISHELHVGKLLKRGYSKERIYSMILLNSIKFAQEGRTWNNYSYLIPGEWNGRYTTLRVIGDKKGGGSSKFFTKKSEIFDTIGTSLGLPVKYIHVIRNPYDMISTLFRKTQNPQTDSIKIAIDKFIKRIERTAELKKTVQPKDWHDVYHEQFLALPDESIIALFRFLHLEIPDGFIENCKKIIYPTPHKSRFDVTWNEADIAFVSHALAPFEHFSSYSYHS
ncbi:MAG: sulfotransferase [Bacteroidota bacterium]